MNRSRLAPAIALSSLLWGCGPGAQVKDRAAHDFSCPKDDIKIKRVAGSGYTGTYEARGCGKTGLYSTMCHPQVGCVVEAEVNAAALSEAAAARPAPESASESAPKKSAEPQEVKAPQGLAGFTFGMSAEEAEKACVDAGHEFEPTSDGGRCSGTVASVGFESEVLMAFCDAAVCHIRVSEKLEPNFEAVTDRYTRMMELLEEKYGKPARHQGDVPSRCEDVAACIAEDKLRLRTDWTMGGGFRVRIRIVEGPALQLDYRAPKEESKGLAL